MRYRKYVRICLLSFFLVLPIQSTDNNPINELGKAITNNKVGQAIGGKTVGSAAVTGAAAGVAATAAGVAIAGGAAVAATIGTGGIAAVVGIAAAGGAAAQAAYNSDYKRYGYLAQQTVHRLIPGDQKQIRYSAGFYSGASNATNYKYDEDKSEITYNETEKITTAYIDNDLIELLISIAKEVYSERKPPIVIEKEHQGKRFRYIFDGQSSGSIASYLSFTLTKCEIIKVPGVESQIIYLDKKDLPQSSGQAQHIDSGFKTNYGEHKPVYSSGKCNIKIKTDDKHSHDVELSAAVQAHLVKMQTDPKLAPIVVETKVTEKGYTYIYRYVFNYSASEGKYIVSPSYVYTSKPEGILDNHAYILSVKHA